MTDDMRGILPSFLKDFISWDTEDTGPATQLDAGAPCDAKMRDGARRGRQHGPAPASKELLVVGKAVAELRRALSEGLRAEAEAREQAFAELHRMQAVSKSRQLQAPPSPLLAVGLRCLQPEEAEDSVSVVVGEPTDLAALLDEQERLCKAVANLESKIGDVQRDFNVSLLQIGQQSAEIVTALRATHGQEVFQAASKVFQFPVPLGSTPRHPGCRGSPTSRLEAPAAAAATVVVAAR